MVSFDHWPLAPWIRQLHRTFSEHLLIILNYTERAMFILLKMTSDSFGCVLTSKPVARDFILSNHSKQHMAVCGLSLHQTTPESRKNLEQKFILTNLFHSITVFLFFTLPRYRHLLYINHKEPTHNSSIRSHERRKFETSIFGIPVRWVCLALRRRDITWAIITCPTSSSHWIIVLRSLLQNVINEI